MLEIGMTGKEELLVTEENTASKIGSGGLNVLATPALIALGHKGTS